MQRFFWVLSIVLTVFTALTVSIAPAWAADVENGAKVFSANCAACHVGGGNVVNGAKTLKKAALEQYQMASSEAIVNQILNGKNAMPAF
ncbi:MAG: c-type cytochrome, partial [Leptolyngbyaceae cyanobacterium SM1_3_5]|nr:c-type cytochrome [Leptolyngbyaceae cyanobacterium SM1_3_5]